VRVLRRRRRGDCQAADPAGPPGRAGRGLGGRLVETCLDFARAAGYRRITLWTNDVLISARRIYQAAGFELVEEERHHSFGRDLVGQNWTRSL
jgi:GNAT superfamily N-acetyltransferase